MNGKKMWAAAARLREKAREMPLEDLRRRVREQAAALRRYKDEDRIRAAVSGDLVEASEHPGRRDLNTGKGVQVRVCARVNQEARRAEVRIPERWRRPKIFAMSDQQLGHRQCDEERLVKDIAWTKRQPECLVVLIGDAVDSATKESPGSEYENKWPPYQQLCRFADMHQGVAEKIIGAVGGNHEARMDRVLGVGAVGNILREKLGKHIPYSSGILLLDVHWRGHLWTFTLFHGAGASATPGGKIQRMQRNMLLSDSRITISGHLHEEAKTSRRFILRRGRGLHVAKQTSLQCGSYLRWLGTYAEVKGLPPGGPDMVLIELHPDGNYTDKFKGEGDA